MNFNFTSPFTDHIIAIATNLGQRAPQALFNVFIGILLIRFLVFVIKRLMKWFQVAPGLRGVLSSVIETILWVYLIYQVLNDLGFSAIFSFFTTSIAAIGIAMAVGGATLISDIVAGIFLARDKDFNVGDEVSLGETPTVGIIERMDARRIRIRDSEGVLHVVPNSVVERKEWVVLHRKAEVSALSRAAKATQHLVTSTKNKVKKT